MRPGGCRTTRRWPGARPTGRAPACCPPPRAKPEAIVHVYAARTGRWKGVFAHHSWIVIKEKGASRLHALRQGRLGPAGEGQQLGARCALVWPPCRGWSGAVEGPAAEALIPKISAAVAALSLQPRRATTRSGRAPTRTRSSPTCSPPSPRPASPCRPPPSARTGASTSRLFGLTPSGTGVQLVVGGLFGVTVGWVEGIEINVLGLVTGIDIRRPALKLPGFGRIGMGMVAEARACRPFDPRGMIRKHAALLSTPPSATPRPP